MNPFFGSDLTNYQKQILDYFEKSNHTVLLLYLTVGCGKTLTSLVCAVESVKKFPNTEIIILSPKSVQDEFKQNLELLNSFHSIPKSIQNKIHMIAYNGNNSQSKFKKLISFTKKYIFIIDELHLFMRGVIKVNLEENEKIRNIGNCQNIFEMIKKIKNKYVIGLTGTPSAKFPFELVPFFNLEIIPSKSFYQEKLFPETVESFENLYIDKVNNKFKNIDLLKQKLKGLVAYHELKTSLKASPLEEIEVEMSEEQYKQYIIDYYLELQEKSFIKHRNIYGIGYGMNSTFHAKTFQDSIYYSENEFLEQQLNLAFQGKLTKDSKMKKIIKKKEHYEISIDVPFKEIGFDFSEENFIRPGHLTLHTSGNEFEMKSFSKGQKLNYEIEGIKPTYEIEDQKKLKNEVEDYKSTYGIGGTKSTHEIEINKIHCPKLIKMYEDTKNINGLCVFYFKFVESGTKIMEEVLKKYGCSKYSDLKNPSRQSKSKSKSKYSYVVFTGNETSEYKSKIKKIFNSPENKHGEIIKYMILSSCGAVGITLKNVRYLGIGCVEFNYSMIRQIMGRVNRLGSHDDLNPEERTLINKIYISVKNKKYYLQHSAEINKICYRTTYQFEKEKGLCIERIIYQDSIYDDLINEEFRKILKSVSVI